MSINTDKRCRIILVGLLVFSLSTTVMKAPWLKAAHSSEPDPKQDFLLSGFSNGAASDLALRSRNRSVNSLDDLLKVTLIPRQTQVPYGRMSLSAFFGDGSSIVKRIDCAIIPVRAPPVYPCNQSR